VDYTVLTEAVRKEEAREREIEKERGEGGKEGEDNSPPSRRPSNRNI
jgi:hypothetical protein